MPLIPTADEQLVLGLLNTTPVSDGVVRDELPDTSAAQRWLAARDLPATRQEAETLLELRTVLQQVVRGTLGARAFQPFLAEAAYWARATDESLTWHLKAPPGHSAATRVVLAWDDLQRSSPGRLRACANPECRLFLIDRSRSNAARWCSMATCGNRLKARRHYQKSREAHPGTGQRP